MTFDERTAAIGTLLRETILPRYKRPEHLDEATARAELADMVSDLNSEWPLMGEVRFREVGEGLARAIRVGHTSRTWPTIAALTKALGVALAPPANPTGDDEAASREAIYGMVREWWGKFKSAMPSVAREEHSVRLVSEGVATWGQLRRGGFPIPLHGKGAAMDEPDPEHESIMESIEAMGDRIRANGNTSAGSLGPRARREAAERAAIINQSQETF